MATIKAFKAVRPTTQYADKVAALPYDVMNSDEAREMVIGNPYSFLHVDRAEIDLPADTDIHDEKVYLKAKENLNKMIADTVLKKDERENLYIYRLTMNGRVQTGLVACTSIDEYLDGTIKKHELTREDKERDRIRHVEVCNANTGPIFLAYRAKKEITEAIEKWIATHAPVYDFTTSDKVGHSVWVIDQDAVIHELEESFSKVPSLYIADGHHRNASAAKVGIKIREKNPGYDKNAEFNFYLSVIFPDNELEILDYNRVVKDLNGKTESEFMKAVSEKFEVTKYTEEGCYKPKEIHTFGMYLNKTWYELRAKSSFIDENNVIDALDASILQKEILTPILGIEDIRTSNKIDFIGGIRGLSELERRVDSGEMAVAFSMYPTSMKELFSIADEEKIMPPKSTWFEPKVRCGLFIHELRDEKIIT